MAECGSSGDHDMTSAVPRAPTNIPSSISPRRRPLETGFECEFVEKPRELQQDCPICLYILREPYQATCCGNSFCRTCIERVKEGNKPCPMCNQENFDVFHDKRLQLSLYDFQVFCTHKADGCEWKGELRELEKHLNSNPTPEKQLDGCMYEPIPCLFCKADFMRKDIQFHQGSKCGMRPYSCEYCRAYESTCNDVIDNHWPVCPSRPVPCPNDCGVYPERRNLNYHLENECTKRTLKCPFSFAGCTATLYQPDMQDHLDSNMPKHLSLVASFGQKMTEVTADLSHKVRELESQVQKLSLTSSKPPSTETESIQVSTELKRADTPASAAADVQQLSREFRGLKLLSTSRDEIIKQQNQRITELEERNQSLQHKVDSLSLQPKAERVDGVQELRSHLYIAPVVYTMPEFSARVSQFGTNPMFKPHPFYTFPEGYKMQLIVNAYGDGQGRGSHMSVFLTLLKGDFDDKLQWPFRGSVSIQILSQDGGQHYTDCITYREGVSDQMAGRVMDDRYSAKPWGKVRFISHSEIYSNFVKNDSVAFCIKKVDLLQYSDSDRLFSHVSPL